MGAGDLAGEAEAEADAVRSAAARGVGAVEPFEEPGVILRGDAGSCVGDGQFRGAVARGEAELDRPAVAVVPHRVAAQVGDRLLEETGVPHHVYVGPEIIRDLQQRCERPRFLGDIRDQLRQDDRAEGWAQLSGVGPRQQQKFARDGLEPVDLLQHVAEGALFFRAGRVAVECLLDLALENGQRRLQLVGGIGAEPHGLAEAALEPVKHPVEDRGQPPKLRGHALGCNALVEVARRDLLGHTRQVFDRAQGPAGGQPAPPSNEQQRKRQSQQEGRA